MTFSTIGNDHKEANLSSISPVSGNLHPAAAPELAKPAAPAPAPQGSDPDHDGDTDKAGAVDTRA